MAYQHFIDLSDLTQTQARALLDDAHQRKAARAGLPKGTADADAPLTGYTLPWCSTSHRRARGCLLTLACVSLAVRR